ncbi:MAG: hypothetical protein C5B53_11730 [Candidatus Melainabacteria bacterium]|nr:MAG: hypothetical protein C5B53_11730 [Candidatus Melainabacteria bacterium]
MPGLTRLHESAITQKAGSGQQPDLHMGLLLVAFFALVAAIFLAYRPVLFNFFAGDDYAYLPWLRQAMRDPEVIWRNFHHPWMDSQLTQFYRPMITATMALEFFFWGPKSLVFRLTNLGCLALASGFLGLIVWDLAILSSIERSIAIRRFAMVAAFLFALYPLHSEATVWLIGRVDSMCTMFSLAAFWCYIRWRFSGNSQFLGVSLSLSILAFTCKETAIALPPTVALCEIIFGKLFPVPAREAATPLFDWKRIAIKTAPYFSILAGYFLLRLVCFGTFIGGYDNSLALNSDPAAFASRIIHGLRMLVVPINKELLGEHNVFVKLWEAGLALCAILSTISAVRNPQVRRLAAFAFLWFVLALVPVYKVFMIADNLQGSRLGYLASVPLSMFIACGALLPVKKEIFSRFLLLFYACMLFLSGFLLSTNNQAWAEAGRLSNIVQRQIRLLYEKLPGDPPVLLVGLPNSYKGAFVCLNAIDGMTKFPQINRDRFNCYALNDSDSVTPFGFLKNSLLEKSKDIRCFYWDSSTRCLKPVIISEKQMPSPIAWQGEALKKILSPISFGTVLNGTADGGISISAQQAETMRPELEINLNGVPCWPVDFLTLKLKMLNRQGSPSDRTILLLYSNEIIGKFDLRYRTQACLEPRADEQEVLLPLHSLPEWCFGGTCHGFRLLLPANANLILEQLALKRADAILPRLFFEHSGYLEKRGTLELNQSHDCQTLFYDCGEIAGASSAVCETTRPSGSFATPNAKNLDKMTIEIKRFPQKNGSFSLKLNDFPSKGLYQLRLRALDKNNNPVGLASDYIVVSVSEKKAGIE